MKQDAPLVSAICFLVQAGVTCIEVKMYCSCFICAIFLSIKDAHWFLLLLLLGVIAGGFGVFLLICIRLAGFLARSNRHVLLWTFKPGLYITGLVLILWFV